MSDGYKIRSVRRRESRIRFMLRSIFSKKVGVNRTSNADINTVLFS